MPRHVLLALALAACAEGATLNTIPGDDQEASTSGTGGGPSDGAIASDANEAVDGAGTPESGAGGLARPDTGTTGTGGAMPESGAGGAGGSAGIVDASSDLAVRETGVVDSGGPPVPDGARGDGAADASVPPRDAAADVVVGDGNTTSVGLEAYWRFDEGAGVNAADSSGRGHAATLTGATWTTGRVGPFALNLNGTNQFAQTTTAVVNTSRPYSVTAWVQLRQVDGAFHTAVGIDGVQVSAFFLQFRPEAPTPGFAFAALPSDVPAAASAVARALTTPMANVWYHLAGVFDGGVMKLYLNGVLQQSVPYTTPFLAAGSTSIGRSRYTSANADFWPGFIDDVRFYSRALTDAEVGLLAQ